MTKIEEIERRVDAIVERERGVATMTVRCGLCDWTFDGPIGEARTQQFEHRLTHAGQKPSPRRVDETTSRCADVVPCDRRDAIQAVAARQEGRRRRWTRDSIVEFIVAYAAEHGHPPASRESPAMTQAARGIFGSYADAIVAAGFDRPDKGTRYPSSGWRPPSPFAPQPDPVATEPAAPSSEVAKPEAHPADPFRRFLLDLRDLIDRHLQEHA